MKEDLRKNVAAVGLELPNGQWILYKDGSLRFEGTGTLEGGAFRAHSQHIRRVEVAGYETIATRQFQNLPLLEEVVLGETVRRVEKEAFYGCKKLAKVTMPQDTVICSGAFAQTSCVSESTQTHPNRLTDTELGRQFMETLNCCLETLEKPFESDQQLKPLVQKLQQGAEARDPALMYLWAEFLFWSDVICYNRVPDESLGARDSSLPIDLVFPGDESYGWMELLDENVEDEPFVWYRRAAEAGYVPAMCWLAWCLRHGIGCKADEEEAWKWLRRTDAAQPVDWLEAEELERFPEYAAYLASLARDAAFEEDEVIDHYVGQGLRVPDGVCPDPNWRSLHVESVGVYNLGCMFGKADCVFRSDLSYDYYIYDNANNFGRYWMGAEKLTWQIWCALHCGSVTQPAFEVLHRWLNEALTLQTQMQEWAENGPESWSAFSQRLDSLLTDLTPEVLRLPE